MSEEGQHVDGEKHVYVVAHLGEPIYIVLKILIFVFLDYRVEPVAIVVQEDTNYGKSAQGVTF